MAFDINAPRVRGPMEHEKLALYAAPAKAGQRRPKLGWSVNLTHPRITVYTNDPDLQTKEHNFGRIQAKLDIPTFQAFLELLKDCTLSIKDALNPSAHPPVQHTIQNRKAFVEGKPVDNPEIINTVVFGRDQAGIIYMSVIEEGKPKIKFEFKFSDWHAITFGAERTPMTDAQLSSLVARSYCHMLKRLFPQSLFMQESTAILNMTLEEKKNLFGGNNGSSGGNQNRNGGNSSYGQQQSRQQSQPSQKTVPAPEPADDFKDDDLPF